MTSEAMADCRMILDKTYTIGLQKWLRMENDISMDIQVVGLFTLKDERDTYWSEGFDPYIRAAFTDEETLQNMNVFMGYPCINESKSASICLQCQTNFL
jgi:hypothetical protein